MVLDLESRDRERGHLLDNLRFLGRSSSAGRVRSLVELVGRIAGDGELCWRIDGPPDARDVLCNRLCETPRSVRRAIEQAETSGLLSVRRMRRNDRSFDRLALSVNWHRLAARDFQPLGTRPVTATDGPPVARDTEPEATATDGPPVARDTGPKTSQESQKPVRPIWPNGAANVAAPEWPHCQTGAANMAAQYRAVTSIPPPPPNLQTATATDGHPDACDTGPEWAAVAARLRNLGLGRWKQTIVDAVANGLSPPELLAIVDVWEAHRRIKPMGAGAITYRVTTGVWPLEGITECPEKSQAKAHAVDEREQHQRWSDIVHAAWTTLRRDTPVGQIVDDDRVIDLACERGVPRAFARAERGIFTPENTPPVGSFSVV